MPEFRRVRLINPRKKSSRTRRRARNAKGHFVRRSAARRSSATRARRRRPPTRTVVRRVSRPRARARKKNPLGEELILLSNPHRNTKRRTNSHRSRPRRRMAVANPYRPSRRPRRNPHRASRPRRNPVSREGVKSFAIEGVKAIAAGAVGAVGCRAIAQGILGDKNVGMMGYAANLALALGGGFLLFKFTKSKSIALGWAVGGAANTVQRIWSEKVSMTSPAAAAPQLSDLDYSSNGMGGVGLSGFVNTGFALPSVTDGGGVIQTPFQPQLPAVSAAAGSGPGGASVLNIPGGNVARFQPRY
jgi:hypothetical protein